MPKKTTSNKPKYRLVEDYRKINTILVDDPHPVPTMNELLDALGTKAQHFVTLDMQSGYHCVPLVLRA